MGGSAGNSHSPQAGALIRLVESVDLVRVAVTRGVTDSTVPFVPFVPFEVVEAMEPLLSSSNELFLVGSGGGGFRDAGGGAG